jgi:exopolysaccharide production protein ExoQ
VTAQQRMGKLGSGRARIAYDSRRLGEAFEAERFVLTVLFVLSLVFYGTIGRDILYNRLNFDMRVAARGDFVGTYIPYARVFVSGAMIAYLIAKTDLRWALSKFPWMLAPFLALAVLSAGWSDDPKHSFEQAVLTTVMCWSTTLYVHRIGLYSTSRTLLRIIAWICIVSALLSIFVPAIGRHTGLETSQSSHVGEWRGLFGHKNILGPYAAWGSVLLLAYPRLVGSGFVFVWVARMGAVLCLIFSKSITNVFTAVFLIGLQIVFYMLRRWRLSAVSLVTVCGVAAALTIVATLGDQILESLDRDATLTGRNFIWTVDYQYFMLNPWLGNGFQRVGGAGLQAYLFAALGQPLATESAYWSLLLDLGIVGFVLFYAPYLLAVWNGMEWIKHVTENDRDAIELQIALLLSSLVIGVTTADIMLSTGLDGVMNFAALFALLTTPKSPQGVWRGEFRLAKYRIPLRSR